MQSALMTDQGTLAEPAAQEQGARRRPLRVGCRDCGHLGRLQVRTPVPTRSPGAWIVPP
jgi:hypothetical protein